jgi:putative cell wall-binding protein
MAAALVASVLTLVAAPASAATPVTVTARTTFSGTDRYNTAEKIHTATNALDAVTDLILVSGDNFPDALAALPLAEKEDAGILLLPQDGTMTAAAVAKATAATHIFIVGGTAALSSAVETKLKTTTAGGGAGKGTANITRYGGSNRFATAAMVANAIGTGGVASYNTKKTAIVVSGDNFADAVSASMLVSGPSGQGTVLTHPIVLTQKDALPASSEISLNNLGVTQVVIIGGEAAVSAAVETELKKSYGTVRIGGTDRFDTAAKVADLAIKSLVSGVFAMDKKNMYLAEMGAASGGADAIAAGQIVNADTGGAVLLGLSGGTLPAATSTWMGANKAGSAGLTVGIIGGTSVVPTATEAAIKTAAGGDASTLTATIAARAGQTTFTVTFSEPVLKSSLANAGDVVVISSVDGTDAATTAVVTDLPSTSLTTTTATYTTAALTKGFEIRLLKGQASTADGRTNGLTTATVGGDTTKPTVSLVTVINGTGTTITVNFSEPVEMVNTLVVGDLKIAGVANTAGLTVKSRLGSAVVSTDGEAIGDLANDDFFDKLIITKGTAFSAGTTVEFVAGAVMDRNANQNTAGTSTVTSDVVVPTVVGSPLATQTTGAAATYSLDNKLLLTSKIAGSGGNDYDLRWAQASNAAGAGGTTVEACTVAGEIITIVWTTAGGTRETTSTAATMKATIDASAGCAALVSTSIVGGGGAFTGAISSAAQAAVAAANFSGGTDLVTITTTFSETIQAVTGAPAGSVKFDGTCGDAFVLNTATKTTITGSIVTTVHSVILDTNKLVPGTSCVDYTTGILDVAGNALVADVDNLTLVG